MKTVSQVEVGSIENHKHSVTKLDALILVGTLLFFPLFIPLGLLRVILTHRHNYRKGYNFRLLATQLLFTIPIIILIGMSGYSDLPDLERTQAIQDYMIIFGIMILVPVVTLLYFEWKERRRFKSLMLLYEDLILKHHIRHIHEIAERSRQKAKRVIDDLQYMIDQKLLPFGTIGNGVLEMRPLPFEHIHVKEAQFSAGDNVININFGQNQILNYMDAPAASGSATSGSTLPKTMECPGCGAKTTVSPSESKECEYCGITVNYA